jgi:carbonic anhydrase
LGQKIKKYGKRVVILSTAIADTLHSPEQLVVDWQAAQRFLREGNQRFQYNQPIQRDTNEQDRHILKEGQNPFAVVVTCSDSRVAPEIYFDQKLGDIFVIRNAGNIADATTLGSIEYAVEHLKAPLVVVVGHSKCGAVTAAFQQARQTAPPPHNEHGSHYPAGLQSILDKIRAGIQDRGGVDIAIDDNISNAVTQIQNNPTVQATGAQVLGAHYNIETGEVVWLG